MNKTIATHIAILATALLAFSKPACALSMTQIENDASSKIDFLLDWTPTPAPNSGTGIGGGPGQALVMAFEDQDSIMLAVYDATFLNPSPYLLDLVFSGGRTFDDLVFTPPNQGVVSRAGDYSANVTFKAPDTGSTLLMMLAPLGLMAYRKARASILTAPSS